MPSTAESAEAWRGATVIDPGSREVQRRWPGDRWAEVARAEARRGHKVVVVDDDSGSATGPAADAADDTVDSGELDDVLEVAGCFVSTDTGAARRAVEAGTPSVTLFGCEEPGFEPDPVHICLWHGRSLSLTESRGADPSLLSVEVEEVLEAIDRLPDAT